MMLTLLTTADVAATNVAAIAADCAKFFMIGREWRVQKCSVMVLLKLTEDPNLRVLLLLS